MNDKILRTLTYGYCNDIPYDEIINKLVSQYKITLEDAKWFVDNFRIAEEVASYQVFGLWGNDISYEEYDYNGNLTDSFIDIGISDEDGNLYSGVLYDTDIDEYGHVAYFENEKETTFPNIK